MTVEQLNQIDVTDDSVTFKNSNGQPILVFANLHYLHPVTINANNLQQEGRQYDLPDTSGNIVIEP